MDILVTFPDGTTELRAANSLCVLDFESPPRAPHMAKHADIEGWCLDGRVARQIGHVRGSPFSWSWRLTGHTEEPYTLTGEWQKVQIETVDEQIERLTRERDAAIAALRKIASHPARMRWSPEKQTSVDADGEPWLHWAEIARMALEGT